MGAPTALPTAHVVAAAMHAAATLDRPGSAVADTRESYWHRAAGGSFAPTDLRMGEQLLLDLGLIIERSERLYPTPTLQALLEETLEDVTAAFAVRALKADLEGGAEIPDGLDALIPDPARREELLAALGRRFDDATRRLYGAIGEELVLAAARTELLDLGYPELARAVRHVSLETDQAGYDVSAPRTTGAPRLLEVKATGAIAPHEAVRIYLSRNEAETGNRFAFWSLVVCSVTETKARTGEIVGWCDHDLLTPRLPVDSSYGRWESASLEIPVSQLVPGIPPAT